MENERKIAVLMTCHNRKLKTMECLKSLYSAILPENYSLDVFVVDDGSTDGTSYTIANVYPLVNIIQGDGNLFWNRGMHLAWETANQKYKYDFYLWLNDDTILFKNALLNAITESEKEENKSIIVGSTCSESMTITTYGGWNQGKLIFENGSKSYCDYFNGNFVLVTRAVFNILGNLNYRYRHTNGDFDYGFRAKKKGIKSIVLDGFVGVCERDKITLQCFDPNIPFLKRLKLFYSPLGKNPFEFFYFNIIHKGFFTAFRIFVSNHLRIFFPGFF